MRLNRVLLLAASFICMALAMVFTISCSGEDGKDGSLKSCTLQGSMSEAGLAVVCEGTTLGIIPPGPQGPAGQPGPAGPAGTLPPEYCKIGSQDAVTGKWNIICNGQEIGGGEIQGQLDNCTTNDSQKGYGIFRIKCPNNPEEIYLCGGVPYSPLENECVAKKSSTDENQQTIFVTAPTWCGGSKYDSRTHFCDAGRITELCGGDKYTTADPDNETCVSGNVTKPCIGTSNRYIKRTQFCMLNAAGNVGTVTARCGAPNEYGVYSVGDSGTTSRPDKYNGRTIMGEYQTSKNQLCEGGKVVMRCGTELYEEKTHFCATGNVVTEHCDDRVQYNPTQRFCSYRANPDYSLSNCKSAATTLDSIKYCKVFASTAMVFCGGNASTPAVTNRYNVGEWLWEYCVPKKNPDASQSSNRVLFSVLRCSANQIPDGVAAAETCRCIPNSTRIAGGNACACDDKTHQYQPLVIKSGEISSSTTITNWLDSYALPGVASANGDPILPIISLPTPQTDAATASFASGLPYNYTVGSGLDLNYGADKGFLVIGSGNSIPGVTTASSGAGRPNIGTLNGAATTDWYDIIPAFIGGTCGGTKPSCANGDYSLCNTAAKCSNSATGTDQSDNSTHPTSVWDVPTNSCVKDENDCTRKFGAKNRICREEQGTCIRPLPDALGNPTNLQAQSNLALDQCATYADCKYFGGFWDYWTLRNKCREKVSDCVSKSVSGKDNSTFTANTPPFTSSNATGTNAASGNNTGKAGGNTDPNLCDKP